jgi:uncharacterized protein YndB with AHSA1/START domain
MPVTSITSDAAALTLTAVGEYPVPVERLWRAWTDPRQLERFWGPPQWPATFTRHDVRVGGRSEYAMTGPEGQSSRGFWVFEHVEDQRGFRIRDGFSNEDGTPNDALPSTVMTLTFEATAAGSRFVAVSRFPNLAAMEALAAMGMVEGLRSALAQLDDTLADLRAHSAGLATALEVLDDTHVRITRTIRGRIDVVWRAHHEAALVRRWMLGPDGWTMPVCDVAARVGDPYRYEWENAADGTQRFGFTGELLEQEAPRRAVTTERMIGMEGPGTLNELTLAPRAGDHTVLTLVITYPSKELRDLVLATGMVDGMETSYARLEGVLAQG